MIGVFVAGDACPKAARSGAATIATVYFTRTAMLRINMRQIEIFDAVMSSGGFKAASRQLNVSVPNVSKVIALLEQRRFCRNKDAGRRMAEK
uniref:helix-turn-helix domain-containing protein n=1 Tax=Burkholderia arboris TaxID=488730 RepID=UPI003BEEEFE4